MKSIIFFLLITMSFLASAQTKDSTNKKDTTISLHKDSIQKKDTVVIPLYEKQDTTAATIVYLGKKNTVRYAKGIVIRKGFAMQKGKDNWQWAEQPKVIAVLDEKRNPIKYVIQIL